MSTTYPTTLDTFTNPQGTDSVATVLHSSQHANANDAITALETKVGITGSVVNTTVDYKLSGVTTGDKAVSKTGTETLTNKTLTTPTIGDFTNSVHTHQNTAGGGTLAEAALALTDVTTNDVSTSKHGFTPKLPNDATKFLNGVGGFAVPAGGSAVTIITSSSATLSMTTTVSQVVVVWAKTSQINSSAVNLLYNAVQKDTVTTSSSNVPAALMYTETPGAGTHNITVTSTGGTLSSTVIIAMIIG